MRELQVDLGEVALVEREPREREIHDPGAEHRVGQRPGRADPLRAARAEAWVACSPGLAANACAVSRANTVSDCSGVWARRGAAPMAATVAIVTVARERTFRPRLPFDIVGCLLVSRE